MSKFFFDDEKVRNKAADKPWMKSDTDKMLDLYFAGTPPNRIAQQLDRNPKAIKRFLEQFTYNERDRAKLYEPYRRATRKGRKLTQNELLMIRAHKERNIPLKYLARVLMRDVDEIDGSRTAGTIKTNIQKETAPTLDLIWAHRYMHVVWKDPIISDKAYDDLVKEEIEYGGGEKAFAKIKNHDGWPEHIRSLAMYLSLKEKCSHY